MTRKEKIERVEKALNKELNDGGLKPRDFFENSALYFISGYEPTLRIDDAIKIIDMYRDILTDN